MSKRLAETNPRSPHFDFVVEDGSSDGRTLTVAPTDRSLEGPPYVTSFTVTRKTRNFSASRWQLSLFDPTFERLEDLLVWFAESDDAGRYGAVNYEIGFADADGSVHASPRVASQVVTIKPTYTRQGMKLTLTGVDLDLMVLSNRIPLTFLASAADGAYSGKDVRAFVQLAMSAAGSDVDVEAYPEKSTALLLMDGFQSFANPNGEYAGLYDFHSPGSDAGATSMSVSSFFAMMEEYCNDRLGDARIKFRIDGSDDGAVPFTVAMVDALASGAGAPPVPEFYLNTTKTDEGEDNLSNVVNFSPALDELHALMYGTASSSTDLHEKFTRAPQTAEFDLSDLGGPQVGDGMMISPKAFDRTQMNALFDNFSEAGVRRPGFDERVDPLDAMRARRLRKSMADNFANWAMGGSMTVAFPPPDVAPWSYVDVRVVTKRGVSPIVSGTWIIRDVRYQVQPGKLTGTFSLTRSGPSGYEQGSSFSKLSIRHDPNEDEESKKGGE